MAEKIISQHNTNDPFEIAEIYDIKVVQKSLPPHIGGFYTRIFDYAYVVVNADKPCVWRKAIAAHELGHALMHNEDHTFLAMNDHVTQSKVEREANQFAATLLLNNEKPMEGETIHQFSCRTNVPVEFIKSLGKGGLFK